MYRPHAAKIAKMRMQTLKMNAMRAYIKRIEVMHNWYKKRLYEKAVTAADIERRRQEGH